MPNPHPHPHPHPNLTSGPQRLARGLAIPHTLTLTLTLTLIRTRTRTRTLTRTRTRTRCKRLKERGIPPAARSVYFPLHDHAANLVASTMDVHWRV